MRLFIAVHFSLEVKQVLLSSIEELRRKAVSGNFTRPENLHLTLAFLGETERLSAVKQAVDRAAVPAFSMTVWGFGRFGSLYWAGIEHNPALSKLAEKLRRELCAGGFRMEARAFRPHITLAREVKAEGQLQISVPRTDMTVSRVCVMKSERIGGKLTYTQVYNLALGP